jgi:predicted metal-dependent HD superfamily phosphohydrolase
MLKDIFIGLANKYTPDVTIAQNLWADIENHYTSPKRYYHNLQHLQNMYTQLEECREQIKDWDTVVFSLFYHDIIYKATAKDNEEKSALAAIKALTAINYPKDKIQLCGEQIIATNSHTLSTENDTNLFTDADLSILGSVWDNYNEYSKQVRKEYTIYPDFIYNPGRKKALQHFLDMENIFKTTHFKQKFEQQARINLVAEIALISY